MDPTQFQFNLHGIFVELGELILECIREEWRVKNSLDTPVERERSQGNMGTRFQDYYKFEIIEAMWC